MVPKIYRDLSALVHCNGKELLIMQLGCYFWVTKQYMKSPDCMYLSCIKLFLYEN